MKKSRNMSFFWFGNKSVSDIYISKKKASEWSTIVEKAYINITKCLKRMKILHKDALLDSEYTDNMYSYIYQLCNKGGLTLVSPECCNFADSIMTKIRSYATSEVLGKDGNNLIIIIDKIIKKYLQLQNQFME